MPTRLVGRPASRKIAQAQSRDRLHESRMGKIRLDGERFDGAHQRFVRPVEAPQGRRPIGKKRSVLGGKLKRPLIGRNSFVHPIEPQQRIAAIAKGVSMIRMRRQHAVETRKRLARPSQFEQRNAAPIEKLGIIGIESETLLVARQRTRKIPQRVEDKPEARETVGTREIALQRLLKVSKRRIEPSATIVNLTEAMQGLEAVRLMLEKFGVKPFGFGKFALFPRPPSTPQQARRIGVAVLH
jgi:hypothetical protein